MASSKVLDRQKLELMTSIEFNRDFVSCVPQNCAYCFSNNTNYCMICNNSFSDYNGKCYSSCPQQTFEFTFNVASTEYKSCANCYENCETCESGEELDNNGKLINMKCTTCLDYKTIYHYLRRMRRVHSDNNEEDIKVIKLGQNCFLSLKNTENEITFNISTLTGIYPKNTTCTCFMFNKTIYANGFECIEKPKNTYYVINNDNNSGVIKNCSKSCKSCEIGNTPNNTNCLECAEGYSHSQNELSPHYNCSKIECYHTCQICSDIPTMNETDIIEQNCILCIDGYHKKVNTNDCYNNSITEKGYYLSLNDSKYHLCDIGCQTCKNKNNCTSCDTEKGYYPIDNAEQTFCYNNKTINNNYILYEVNTNNFMWKKCHEFCKSCYNLGNATNMNCLSCNSNLFLTDNGNCLSSCPIGTYKFYLNNTCIYFCPEDYIINNDKCKKQNDKITSVEFKNELLNNNLFC